MYYKSGLSFDPWESTKASHPTRMTIKFFAFRSQKSHRKRAAACAFLSYTLLFLGLVHADVPGDLTILPDEEKGAVSPRWNTDCSPSRVIENTPFLTGKEIPSRLPPGTRDHSKILTGQKSEKMQQVALELESEFNTMMSMVQLMDWDTAAQWTAGFLSSRPWSCPAREQGNWTRAILGAVERNGLPLCKEILGMVSSIISIESSFSVDPPVVDPSRGEDISNLLERAEKDIQVRFGSILSIPPLPQLYRIYRERYYSQLLACRTEGEIELLAQKVVDDLMADLAFLPAFLRASLMKEIDRISTVVRTKGSMQLNFIRAKKVMKDRGEHFNDTELTDYMYTLEGGLDVGVASLKPIFVQYAARYAVPGNLSWLFFVGMDYHYGPFSSRNMMEQIRISDLSGRKIAIDGDFLRYDDRGRPGSEDSETFDAVIAILGDMPKSHIWEALEMEKDPHYIYTDVHRRIADGHLRRFGETPFAVIGELWTGEHAAIKHGSMWTTQSYMKKLDRYINAIPWDN